MKKEDSAFTVYAGVCSVLMLIILFITLFITKARNTSEDIQVSDELSTNTEYIYVYVYPEETQHTAIDTSENGWIIREYEEQIGIFNLDNVLIKVIPVYTNTLPVADRDLLREGIRVNTKKELISVIEDYTG